MASVEAPEMEQALVTLKNQQSQNKSSASNNPPPEKDNTQISFTPTCEQRIVDEVSKELVTRICNVMINANDLDQTFTAGLLTGVTQKIELLFQGNDSEANAKLIDTVLGGIQQSFGSIKGSSLLLYSLLQDQQGLQLYNQILSQIFEIAISKNNVKNGYMSDFVNEVVQLLRNKPTKLFIKKKSQQGGKKMEYTLRKRTKKWNTTQKSYRGGQKTKSTEQINSEIQKLNKNQKKTPETKSNTLLNDSNLASSIVDNQQEQVSLCQAMNMTLQSQEIMHDYASDLLGKVSERLGNMEGLILNKILDAIYYHIKHNPKPILESLVQVITNPRVAQGLNGASTKILLCSCLYNNSTVFGNALTETYMSDVYKGKKTFSPPKIGDHLKKLSSTEFLNGFTANMKKKLEQDVFHSKI